MFIKTIFRSSHHRFLKEKINRNFFQGQKNRAMRIAQGMSALVGACQPLLKNSQINQGYYSCLLPKKWNRL